MKKLLVILMSVILTSCSMNEKPKDSQVIIKCGSENWGIILMPENVTPSGMTLLIKQEGGNPTGELQTGNFFKIETFDGEEWESAPTNPLIDYAWHQVAYMIKKNDTTEFEVDWKWLYGELSPGKYRIGKEIMDFRGPGDFDELMYYAEFEVR